MTDATLAFDERLKSLLQVMAGEGIHRAAEGFAGMLGKSVEVANPEIRLVPLGEIPALLGGPENEAVGIYLQVQGDLPGQMMLVLPYAKALGLADLLMDLPAGANQQLGPMERSALAEVGNITGSFFLNAVASFTGLILRPSPPAVMVDMVGAIIDVIVATSGGVSDHVLMIQSGFMREGREVQADFWVIPDTATLRSFAEKEGIYDRPH